MNDLEVQEIITQLLGLPVLAGTLAFFYFSYKVLIKHLDNSHDKFISLLKELRKDKKNLDN